jgi:putative nucleotidyltransferase with HDIG domain
MQPIDESLEFVRLALETKNAVIVQPGSRDCQFFMVAASFGDETGKFTTTNRAAWMRDEKSTFAVIPLIGKNELLGLIISIYEEKKSFTDRDLRVVRGLSHIVSFALDEAHLYRAVMERSLALDHKIKALQVIHEIDRSIFSSLDPDEILETVAKNVPYIVPCDKVGIMLVDHERAGFVYASGGEWTQSSLREWCPFSDTLATDVIKSMQLQYVGNITELDLIPAQERKMVEAGFASYIRVPLAIKEEAVGVMSLYSKRPAAFSVEHLLMLERLTSEIGQALQNTRLLTDFKELFLGTVKSLSKAIDAKSHWSAGHSERVTRYALLLGREAGLTENELKDLELAGLLHDIGKVATYDAILEKTKVLTAREFTIMQKHPHQGVELLEPITQLRRILPAIRHHHERYDGTGYPAGLKGNDIPLWARILAVCDAYDAMTTKRPYREPFSEKEAIEELQYCAGSQFDPTLVEQLLGILQSDSKDRKNITRSIKPVVKQNEKSSA